ncbi:hypothetical protein FKM82_017733 [Ascaphus truei]
MSFMCLATGVSSPFRTEPRCSRMCTLKALWVSPTYCFPQYVFLRCKACPSIKVSKTFTDSKSQTIYTTKILSTVLLQG